eukprot:2017087-Pleurochrysis_carterae.AAC.3
MAPREKLVGEQAVTGRQAALALCVCSTDRVIRGASGGVATRKRLAHVCGWRLRVAEGENGRKAGREFQTEQKQRKAVGESARQRGKGGGSVARAAGQTGSQEPLCGSCDAEGMA